MTHEELENLLRNAVEDYIADEEAYDDNARLRIDPQSKEVSITDGADEVEDADYYDVMDFIKMSPADTENGRLTRMPWNQSPKNISVEKDT